MQDLRSRLPDQFSHDMLDSALHVLGQTENKLRAHQFAGTLRELIDHVLANLAPDAEVMRCLWFEQLKEREGPTRRQRALYACRGGLTDDFLKNTLKLKPNDLYAEFSEVFAELNNRVHVKAHTTLTDPDEIEEFADKAIAVLVEVFETIDEVHTIVVDAIGKELQGEATTAFINKTIQELDQIAGRYETGAVFIEETKVLSLDADGLRCRVTGGVDATLVYGSKGERTEIDESFPYECTTFAPAANPTNFDSCQTEMKVDTSSWYGDGEYPPGRDAVSEV